jgi:uncharacterized membrane protein
MESRARLLGHSIHQALIVFPLGLLATGVVFDIVALAADSNVAALVAYWMMVAGIIGGLIAAPFGWIDWSAIPSGTRAKRIGLIHAAVNVVALILFAISVYFRYDAPGSPQPVARIFSFVGLAIAGVGGWLGGELVTRLGIGVDPGANANAPNSLSGRPAAERVR